MSELQRYRADIQGLRALAVVPVVLFHADEDIMPGGFVGVDVFFVISGYLISRILIRELEAGQFSIAGFYERRVRRIFPALYVMLLATAVVGCAILPPRDLIELARTTLATALFYSNWTFWQLSDYFAGPTDYKPLLHTWSLSVEEQFYVLFPPFLWLIHRHARRHLRLILWLTAAASLLASIYVTSYSPTTAFYLPFCRAFELLCGSLLAARAIPLPRHAAASDVLSVTGLVSICSAMAFFSAHTRFPGLAALLPCVGATLIIATGEDREPLAGRLLGIAPLTWVGTISYSLYLWHWPILSYLRWFTLGQPAPWQLTTAVVAGVAMAWLSYAFVEQPVIRNVPARPTMLLGGALAMVAATLGSLALIITHGLPARFSPSSRALLAFKGESPFRDRCHSREDHEIAYGACVLGAPGHAARVAVFGDSFGVELAAALAEHQAPTARNVMQLTASACPPVTVQVPTRHGCAAHNGRILQRLADDRDIHTVVLVALIDGYPDLPRGALAHGLEGTARTLQIAGKRIILVYPTPGLPIAAPVMLGFANARHRNLDNVGVPTRDFVAVSADNRRILDAIVLRTGGGKLDPSSRLCDHRLCHIYRRGVGPLFFDDRHLSMAGARDVLATVPIL